MSNNPEELEALRQRTIQVRRDMHALVTAHLTGQAPPRALFLQMLEEKPATGRAPYAAELVHLLTGELATLLARVEGGTDAAITLMTTASAQFEELTKHIEVRPVDENGDPLT